MVQSHTDACFEFNNPVLHQVSSKQPVTSATPREYWDNVIKENEARQQGEKSAEVGESSITCIFKYTRIFEFYALVYLIALVYTPLPHFTFLVPDLVWSRPCLLLAGFKNTIRSTRPREKQRGPLMPHQAFTLCVLPSPAKLLSV